MTGGYTSKYNRKKMSKLKNMDWEHIYKKYYSERIQKRINDQYISNKEINWARHELLSKIARQSNISERVRLCFHKNMELYKSQQTRYVCTNCGASIDFYAQISCINKM
ncbi:hypothetical protein AKO1_012151 [Acrasis kona]